MPKPHLSPLVCFNGQRLQIDFNAPHDDQLRDLFGEIIPPTVHKNVPDAKKSAKKTKTPVPRKKKSQTALSFTPKAKTPRDKTPKIAQTISPIIETIPRFFANSNATDSEIFSDLFKSIQSKNTTVDRLLSLDRKRPKGNRSLNVSEVECLSEMPFGEISDLPKGTVHVFEGVCAFIDYKMDFDFSGMGVKHYIETLGGTTEDELSPKVTHVVFRDGSYQTYDTAMELNIPLVSARWVDHSMIANRIMKTIEYPPINMDSYIEPREYNYKFTFGMADSIDTSFIAAEMERDSKFLQECNEFMSTITPIKRSREIEPDDSNTTDVTTEQIQKKQKFTDANEADTTVRTPRTSTITSTSATPAATSTSATSTITSTSATPDATTTPLTSSATTADTSTHVTPYKKTKKSPMPKGIINVLAEYLLNVLNSDKPIRDEKTNPAFFPIPIKLLRKLLIPNADDSKHIDDINDELIDIENYLNLTAEKRQLLRGLLFSTRYTELVNMGKVTDSLSPESSTPAPESLASAPESLASAPESLLPASESSASAPESFLSPQ